MVHAWSEQSSERCWDRGVQLHPGSGRWPGCIPWGAAEPWLQLQKVAAAAPGGDAVYFLDERQRAQGLTSVLRTETRMRKATRTPDKALSAASYLLPSGTQIGGGSGTECWEWFWSASSLQRIHAEEAQSRTGGRWAADGQRQADLNPDREASVGFLTGRHDRLPQLEPDWPFAASPPSLQTKTKKVPRFETRLELDPFPSLRTEHGPSLRRFDPLR